MLPQEQQKLDKLYQSMVKALKRQGMSDVTIDTYQSHNPHRPLF